MLTKLALQRHSSTTALTVPPKSYQKHTAYVSPVVLFVTAIGEGVSHQQTLSQILLVLTFFLRGEIFLPALTAFKMTLVEL